MKTHIQHAQNKLRLGIIFGSRSVEHEVSIITACQLMKHVDREKYDVVPLYIDKVGRWWTGEAAGRIESYKNQDLTDPQGFTPYHFSPVPGVEHGVDVAIVACHGTFSEDGTLQGLLEFADIPYPGPNVLGSAVEMDKIVFKKVMEASGIPVANFQWFTSDEWQRNRDGVLTRLLDPENEGHKKLHFPLFVKPANLGSSVGITKATDTASLAAAIDVAVHFDRRILVEQGLTDTMEVNISVVGFENFEASVPEQPISSGELLSYTDKYEGGGKKMGGMASLKRRIPAPIPASLAKRLQETAITVCRQNDCSGVMRLDFFVNPETSEFWIGEVNAPPGSMAYYLWEASGVPYPKLIDRLVEIAYARKAVQRGFTRSISTTIIK